MMSIVRIHVGVYQRCRAIDFESPALQAKKRSIGAMDESSGKGSMMQAHIISGVVMDITAFEVNHSADKDATALQAKKWSA